MTIYIDNTNVLRVSSVTSTALDGTETLLTADGTFTMYDLEGVEVVGQTWPTALTLNSPGDYAGILESDIVLVARRKYNVVVTIGTAPNELATFNCILTAQVREC